MKFNSKGKRHVVLLPISISKLAEDINIIHTSSDYWTACSCNILELLCGFSILNIYIAVYFVVLNYTYFTPTLENESVQK